MFDISTFPKADAVRRAAQLSQDDYQRLYRQSIEHPSTFWAEQATRFLDWSAPWQTVQRYDLKTGEASWFAGATLNVSYNCIDRHLEKNAAIKSRSSGKAMTPPNPPRSPTKKLHHNVCRLANVLKSRGVKKGDRVCIYMPMIPEAAYAMLACARIGAIHSVVFGGFSPDSLRDRILDADCRTVITADEGVRGGKFVPLKQNVDTALQSCPDVNTVIVVERTQGQVNWVDDRDIWYHQALRDVSDDCPPEPMEAEDPLFILYTSGSTGKPKGVLHTTGGYLLQVAMTFKYVLDYRDGEVFLVHRRCRLGHRPQLHRLRAAGQRGDHADLRRCAELPQHFALLAGDRQAPREHLLHRSDRVARVDA